MGCSAGSRAPAGCDRSPSRRRFSSSRSRHPRRRRRRRARAPSPAPEPRETRVTHERQLERVCLLQDLAVVALSLGLAHVVRDRLAGFVPGLKPAVPAGDYVLLMVVFAPTWAWCAERLGLHRVRTLTGPPLDLLRALVWTQAWGAVAIAVILAAAQVSLNRSFIAVFLVLSTGLLGATLLAQRAWIGRRRGRALALFVGPDDGGVVSEL